MEEQIKRELLGFCESSVCFRFVCVRCVLYKRVRRARFGAESISLKRPRPSAGGIVSQRRLLSSEPEPPSDRHRVSDELEDGSNEVAKLASGNDTSSKNAQSPKNRKVTSAVLGSENLVVDESDQEVGLLGSWPARRRREEAFLSRAIVRESRLKKDVVEEGEKE